MVLSPQRERGGQFFPAAELALRSCVLECATLAVIDLSAAGAPPRADTTIAY